MKHGNGNSEGKIHLNLSISLVSSLLFATHPIHTEAVNNIVGRADILATLFSILAMLSYIQSHRFNEKSPKTNNGQKRWREWIQTLWIISCFVFLLLSSLSKELGLTMAGVLFCYDLIYCSPMSITLSSQQSLSTIKTNGTTSSSQSISMQQSSPLLSLFTARRKAFSIMLAVFVVAFVLFRSWFFELDRLTPTFSKLYNPIAYESEFLTRLLSFLYINSCYVWLLVFPFSLSTDYSFNCIPPLTSWSDSRNLLTLMSHLFMSLVLFLLFT